jgi:putative endonuclease
MNTYFVYIMTNPHNTVLYTGVTNDLIRRVAEHREGVTKGFTSKYNCNKLVYFEPFGSIELAIGREKQLKAGSRAKKEQLVQASNPDWTDLWESIRP